MDSFEKNRKQMVDRQIILRGIKDKNIIDAMLKIPRHKFVSTKLFSTSYNDEPLPIDFGQTISQPYIVALMIELLKIKKNDKVLEIGTGSGYQTAILAELSNNIYTMEINSVLQKKAKKLLDELGYRNIFYLNRDGYAGWEEFAPFNKIVVSAAPQKLPKSLVEQLSNNGKLIIPIGSLWQNLYLISREKDKIKKEKLIGVRFVPLIQSFIE